jgi:GNAT superfamily N-acetyltransferase
MREENSAPPRSTRATALRIRRARAADLDALLHLYDELHLENYRKLRVPRPRMAREFARLSRNRNHAVLVAELRGRIVGTCHVIVVPHLGHALKPFAIVENVVVASDARSEGIGQRMMEAAGALARKRGCYKIALSSHVNRIRAHRFYERLGWTRTHFGYSLGIE